MGKRSDTAKLGDDVNEMVEDPDLGAATGGTFDAFANFGDIKGESTDKEHRDWVAILSWTGR